MATVGFFLSRSTICGRQFQNISRPSSSTDGAGRYCSRACKKHTKLEVTAKTRQQGPHLVAVLPVDALHGAHVHGVEGAPLARPRRQPPRPRLWIQILCTIVDTNWCFFPCELHNMGEASGGAISGNAGDRRARPLLLSFQQLFR